MRAMLFVVPLAALLAGCQDATAPGPEAPAPASEVSRFRFDGDGFLSHIIPDRGIAFTVGLLTPVADLPECGGPSGVVDSDLKGFSQQVSTPAGPIKSIERISGTFVVYQAVLSNPGDYCLLASAPVIGTGRGSFTRNDNSVTGVGPGMNSFGYRANAVLELTGGGRALLHVVARVLFDGVNVRVIVDDVDLKPIGH